MSFWPAGYIWVEGAHRCLLLTTPPTCFGLLLTPHSSGIEISESVTTKVLEPEHGEFNQGAAIFAAQRGIAAFKGSVDVCGVISQKQNASVHCWASPQLADTPCSTLGPLKSRNNQLTQQATPFSSHNFRSPYGAREPAGTLSQTSQSDYD